MAFEIPGQQYTFVAHADLRLKRYYFVKMDTDGEVDVCSAVTDQPIGILQNTPNVGELATVMVNGVSKVVCEANLAKNDPVGTHDNGKADVYAYGTDTTKYIVGRVLLDNSAQDGIATIIFNCIGVGRAT